MKAIDRSALHSCGEQYEVISTRLLAGRTVIHVASEAHPEGFEPVAADLEDVYFHALSRSAETPAAVAA